MTCTTADDGRATLALEGSLAGRAVDELAAVAATVVHRRPALTLDLAGVTFVDAAGAALLRALAADGAQLAGGSPFVTALVGKEAP